jgi:hypothetical protein
MTAKEKALQIIENVHYELDGIAAYDYSNTEKKVCLYIVDELLRCTQGAIYYQQVKTAIEQHFMSSLLAKKLDK